MTDAKNPIRARASWYSPHSIWRSFVLRPRLLLGLAAWIAALLLLPSSLPLAVREALAWCCGGLVYLAMAFRIMSGCTLDRIKSRAALQDDSAIVILVLILLAVVSSFLAIAGLLSQAKVASETGKVVYVLIAAATILTSWTVMQVVFTMHYAHAYYAPEDASDGLQFPNDKQPDYWDFFYFAVSIGVASQTADVSITSKRMRRLVTLHAIVSFFFNTMVLALTINLAASMI